jgi:hypothetical protein
LIAGWKSGLPSLMPNFSLTRESLLQTEGQSHHHTSTGKSWALKIESVSIDPEIKVGKKPKDVPKLKVWGITRSYCWLYFARLSRWKPNVSS